MLASYFESGARPEKPKGPRAKVGCWSPPAGGLGSTLGFHSGVRGSPVAKIFLAS